MIRAGLMVAAVWALGVCAGAQTVEAAKDSAHTAFESASVRVTPPNRNSFTYGIPSGARMTESGIPMDQLIQLSFGVERRDLEAPDWTKTARYDIEARTENGVQLTREQMQPLMQGCWRTGSA